MHTSNIKKMYAFNFCINLHFIGGVLVPFFTDWGRLNYTQIMLLQAWFSICLFLLEIPTGAVADRFGRKVSLLLGVCTLGIAVCIYGSIPSFAVFMLGEFLFATAMALMSGADEALLYDSLVGEGQEKQAKTILGRFISASRLAMMLSAPLGSLIAKYLGLQETMRLIVIPCFLAFILAALLYEPEYRKPEEKESLSYTQTLVRGATGLVKNRILRIMALDAVPVSVLIFYLIWLYQPLL
ncbi:MAG TPA: MFS transporter, partial [bacterium]|nr:MFS transporter [bacterium]